MIALIHRTCAHPSTRACLMVAGMKWTDRHQGLMLAGVVAVALIGFQICRLTGAPEVL